MYCGGGGGDGGGNIKLKNTLQKLSTFKRIVAIFQIEIPKYDGTFIRRHNVIRSFCNYKMKLAKMNDVVIQTKSIKFIHLPRI